MGSDDDDGDEVIHVEPDDQGRSRVQSNGQLYVGREYAGDEVNWWITTDEEDE
ncbi:MAG: hypothetical protein ACOC9N_01110 [Gemmatimonadota bacterium]